eukprot:EC686806.1.p4 GENE.EC686806.1~~EC686806.1.p4  ORF type:complete len:115 (+),score=39.27 EC686806.1:1-345(+)
MHLRWSFGVVLAIALVIGHLYAWNAAVSRGLMSKLAPIDKKGEAMGLYSMITYLAISAVSLVYSLMTSAGYNSNCLLLLCASFMLPGIPLLLWLRALLRRDPAWSDTLAPATKS